MIAYKQRVMDMDKQEQAQRFAEILLKTTHANHGHLSILELENISETTYSLADYMQAEADKRKKEKQDKAKQEQKNYEDALNSIGKDWQPDWGQAPRDINYWFKNGKQSCRSVNEPELVNGIGFYAIGFNMEAPSFGYKGDWKNSLRKRPQGI